MEDAHETATVLARRDVADDTRANGNCAGAPSALQATQDNEACIVARFCKPDARTKEHKECEDVGNTPTTDVGNRAPEAWSDALEDEIRRDCEIDELDGDFEVVRDGW